jgi:hypothetical protein
MVMRCENISSAQPTPSAELKVVNGTQEQKEVETDNDQELKWLEFMGQSLPDQIEIGKKLLQSMEVLDDDMEVADGNVEEQSQSVEKW